MRDPSKKGSPRERARDALDLLDTHLQEDLHGDIDGVETIDAGLRALATALTELYDIPVPEGMRPVYIDDALNSLVAREIVGDEARRLALKLQKAIVEATYHGLDDEALEQANESREALWKILNKLVDGEDTQNGT